MDRMTTASDNNYDQRIEDMKRTMALFKKELNELIETYIDPWIKDGIEDEIERARIDSELELLGKWDYGEENNTM